MGKRFYIGLIALAAAFIFIRVLSPKILPRILFSKSARVASTAFETYAESALNPDGRYLARIAPDGKELIVEKITAEGKLEKVHSAEIDFTVLSQGSSYPNMGLSWAEDGATLVAHSSNQLAIFDAESGYSATINFRALFPSPKYGDKTGFRNAWVSPGAHYLVAEQQESGVFDGLVFSRTGTAWKEIRELNSSVGFLNQALFSGDGKYLAVLSSELVVEETVSGKLIADRNKITKQITSSYDRGIFPGNTLIMSNSGALSYYDAASGAASSVQYTQDETIAFDKTGGRILSVSQPGWLTIYKVPPDIGPSRTVKNLRLDPSYRKSSFAIWSHYKAGEYPAGTTYIMHSAAVRPDGKLLFCLNTTGFIYQKNVTCTMEMLDTALAAKLDDVRITKISSYAAYAVLLLGLLVLLITEFGAAIISRFTSEKTSAGTVHRGESGLQGTTPGVVVFGLDGKMPTSVEGMAAITLFAMHSGNAHLMMDAIPKTCAFLPAEPDTEAEVVAAYQRIARSSGWKVITPECKTIRGGGGSRVIAYPAPEQL